MTEFSLLVTAGPLGPGAFSALRTARAIQASSHSLYRLFFYGDGVLLANRFLHDAGSAGEAARAWQDWVAAERPPATVCVGAAQKRGLISDNLADGFALAGLGDWVDALGQGERVVHFG
ncbi:DsrE/DsrF/TusD sulfur relay family protein [Alloalcanivorax profundimaris]|uniref:DsrE/DsrF/TusD sulfur relay family protein n=1 Tax=Alloalcanivorax profundimaris TaxID=2735259 RepID=UPI0018889D9B|nr:DsrE family protein [Alloalcanivorax profundimaris]MBF1801424.1 multidrug transporter [Alloalcanivorax profundimaris]MCQ6261688.1 DsrE family protein [Alcanivorax sp. MM125-6]